MASPLRRSLVLFLGVTLALLVSCKPGGEGSAGAASRVGDDASALTASVTVSDPVVGGGIVEVTVRDGDAPVSGATVELQGDMTHVGMTPVIATAEEVGPGLYRAEGFGFSMAGDWVVTAEVSAPDGRGATAEAFVTVAR